MRKKSKIFNKKKIKSFSIDLIFIIAACCFGAYSTVAVLIPNGLTAGGLTGIIRIVQNFVNIDFSILYYCGTAVIIAIVWIFLGFKEIQKIILLSIIFPAVLFLFEQFNLHLLEEKDILLAVIFCGVFTGISSGLAFWRGYSFAGTDAIAKVLRKKLFPHFSQSKIMLMLDVIVITGAAFIFGRNIALYALVTQVILSKTIDVVLYGFQSQTVQLVIITDRGKEIVNYIVEDVGRGVSSHEIIGEYSQRKYKELRLLCSPRESIIVKKRIAKIDPKAFVTVIQVDSVWGAGKGFKGINED